jgi:taurine dioxygenase
MRAGYAALPAEIQTLIRGRLGSHDRNFRYAALYPERPPLTAAQVAQVPPVTHPLVRRHPVTGKISAFVAKDVVSGIIGMDDAQARPLIDRIEATGTRPEFVYSHKWQPGDVLIWDNTCTLHRATPFDNKYNRMLYRTQVQGATPIPG